MFDEKRLTARNEAYCIFSGPAPKNLTVWAAERRRHRHSLILISLFMILFPDLIEKGELLAL